MKEILDFQIDNWPLQPFPLWNPVISKRIINAIFSNDYLDSYSISQTLTGDKKSSHLIPLGESNVFPALELPSLGLEDFYERHGLIPEFSTQGVRKINTALACIKLIDDTYQDVTCLVKTIQIIRADDSDSDTSYSHPEIPFSIFVSVCESDSLIADLRVAESILHEAMHLKLTLIECLIPFVDVDSKATFFSPWRQCQRPVRGVLHGLFVFRTLLDFFVGIKPNHPDVQFIDNRIDNIKAEILAISHFSSCDALTTDGKNLVKSLLTNIVA